MARACTLLLLATLLFCSEFNQAYIVPPKTSSSRASLLTQISNAFVVKARGPLFASSDEDKDKVIELVQEQLKAFSANKVKANQLPAANQLTGDEQISVVAAGIGGAILGLLLGGFADLNIPDIDLITSPIVPPIVGSIALTLFGFARVRGP